MKRNIHKLTTKLEKHRLSSVDFTIISNNCWGFEIYQNLGRVYNTPFVGLFLPPECYLRLLEHFDDFPNWKLTFSDKSAYMDSAPNYPVGILPHEIEVHFLHYGSRKEAKEKWCRRIDRFTNAITNGSTVLVKFCDRSNAQKNHLIRYHKLNFQRKVSFGILGFDSPNHIQTPFLKEKGQECVVDGLKLFRNRHRCFDFCLWVKTGKTKRTFLSRIQAFLIKIGR